MSGPLSPATPGVCLSCAKRFNRATRKHYLCGMCGGFFCSSCIAKLDEDKLACFSCERQSGKLIDENALSEFPLVAENVSPGGNQQAAAPPSVSGESVGADSLSAFLFRQSGSRTNSLTNPYLHQDRGALQNDDIHQGAVGQLEEVSCLCLFV